RVWPPARRVSWSSEVHLRAEHDCAFCGPGAGSALVEDRALEVEDVPDVLRQIPVEAQRPGLHRAARARGGQLVCERVFVDAQRVVAGGHLQGAPMALPGIKTGARPDATARIGRGLAREDPRAGNL